ncbi:transposase [Streptomyces sp. NPDC054770]
MRASCHSGSPPLSAPHCRVARRRAHDDRPSQCASVFLRSTPQAPARTTAELYRDRLHGRPQGPGAADTRYRRVRLPPGRTYGTVLVDIETSRPVDVLPDRETSTVAARLLEHPGAEIVCRDRLMAFTKAINQAAPDALDVADRSLHNQAAPSTRVPAHGNPRSPSSPSCPTYLANNGVPDHILARWVGHTNVKTTEKLARGCDGGVGVSRGGGFSAERLAKPYGPQGRGGPGVRLPAVGR